MDNEEQSGKFIFKDLINKYTIVSLLYTIANTLLFVQIGDEKLTILSSIWKLSNAFGIVVTLIMIIGVIAILYWGYVRRVYELKKSNTKKDELIRSLKAQHEQALISSRQKSIRYFSDYKDIQKQVYRLLCNLQTIDDYVNTLMISLKPIASDLEDLLSEIYEKSICVNVKVITDYDAKMVQTVARGKRNLKIRGRNKDYDLDPHPMTHDTPYNIVVVKGIDHFMSGNLVEHRKKYDDFEISTNNWDSKIASTMVLPLLRENVFGKEIKKNPPLGLICIDCKDSIDEWNCENDNVDSVIAYDICQSIACSLGAVLSEYEDRMKCESATQPRINDNKKV